MIISIELGGEHFAVDLYGNASLSRTQALAQTGIRMEDLSV